LQNLTILTTFPISSIELAAALYINSDSIHQTTLKLAITSRKVSACRVNTPEAAEASSASAAFCCVCSSSERIALSTMESLFGFGWINTALTVAPVECTDQPKEEHVFPGYITNTVHALNEYHPGWCAHLVFLSPMWLIWLALFVLLNIH
jgi:hypothetical protein